MMWNRKAWSGSDKVELCILGSVKWNFMFVVFFVDFLSINHVDFFHIVGLEEKKNGFYKLNYGFSENGVPIIPIWFPSRVKFGYDVLKKNQKI